MKRLTFGLALIFFFGATFIVFSFMNLKSGRKIVQYVSIGDSFSKGTGAQNYESWPSVLAKDLTENGITTHLIDNPSSDGSTTAEALQSQIKSVIKNKPDFVSIMLGTNDIVQDVSLENFEKNLREIIRLTQENLLNKNNILLVSIPDISSTNYGSLNEVEHDAIAKFNVVIKKIAEEKHLMFSDIGMCYNKIINETGAISADGIHPSSLGYTNLETHILSSVKGNIQLIP